MNRRILLLCLTILFTDAFQTRPSKRSLSPRPIKKAKTDASAARRRIIQEGRGGRFTADLTLRLAESPPVSPITTISLIQKFIDRNFFLLGMFLSVAFASLFPALGKSGGILRPELFFGQYGVFFVFLLSGLSLELSQLADALKNLKLNAAIQAVIFIAWPLLVGIPLTRLLGAAKAMPQSLLDGLLILSCLPTTINMCIILTATSGGNVASALSNAVLSNLLGIAATPALLFRFFGSEIQVPLASMLVKLSKSVVLPVAIGQVMRRTKAKALYEKNSKVFKRMQEVTLLGILWNAFCTAFSKTLGLDVRSVLYLLVLLPVLHGLSLVALFLLFSASFFSFKRGEVIAATFCASQKTLAFGLPLINTIFEGNANLAAYCAPIMLIHPLQLVLGSMLVPRFQKYASQEDA